jgi:hypothetical protein
MKHTEVAGAELIGGTDLESGFGSTRCEVRGGTRRRRATRLARTITQGHGIEDVARRKEPRCP